MRRVILRLFATVFFVISFIHLPAQGDDSDIITPEDLSTIQTILGEAGNMPGVSESLSKALGELGGYLGKGAEIGGSASDLYNAMQALDNNECVPDFSTDASAMMPTGCMDNEGCKSCYERALDRLTTVRRSLARMSCINSNTKSFTESAIAFGDDVSSIHGITGLAWQYERKGIKDTYEKFKKTYDRKYAELMQSLQKSLQQISECETQYGIRDWYQKFGFMYFEMMKEKYKRTD
ncbi:MAG TPA: hypothetical protein VJ111_03965 [Chitinophagaceae bacterium]|nr:hypothetical protein [Chitinophagaceae bacterium]